MAGDPSPAPSRVLVQTFRDLEQNLCRVENRTSLFAKGDTALRDHGHHALAGLVLCEAHEFLRTSRVQRIPTREAMANHLHVGANQITHLFNGEPSTRRNWCRDCNALLSWLLQEVIANNSDGQDAAAQEELARVRDRIRRYFFRDIPPAPGQQVPSFFTFARRFAAVPCSLLELSQEVEWFARQPDVGGFKTEIIVVLGGDRFPPFDPRKYLLGSLREAIRAGVRVTFVSPQVGERLTGAEMVEQLRREFPQVRWLQALSDGVYEREGERRKVAGPLQEAGISFPWGHALYMHSVSPGPPPSEEEREVCVYLHLRQFTDEHPPLDHEPVACAATLAERAAFAAWRANWSEGTPPPVAEEPPPPDSRDAPAPADPRP